MKESGLRVGRSSLFKQARSPFYNLRVMVKGRRRQFSTGETTKGKAADKARAILADLRSRGLIETISLHSRRVDEVPTDPTIDELGNLYEKVMAVAEFPPSFQTRSRYVKSLRHVGRSLNIVRIRTMKPEKIKRFIADYLAEGAKGERPAPSVKTSLNSILRNCAAIFSRAALAGYKENGLILTNPFAGLKLRRIEIRGYTPLSPEIVKTIWSRAALLRDGDPWAPKRAVDGTHCPVCGKLLPKKGKTGPAKTYCGEDCRESAKRLIDWAVPHPEAYVLLLLELGLGLRRHESDKAQQDWFFSDTSGRVFLEVKTTPFFVPKSRERRVIPVAKALSEAIRSQFRDGDPFIVPGRTPKAIGEGRPPKNLVYRCDEYHRQLAAWLRAQGINDGKPCHVLRKQFGSYVATTFGLFHAQKFLGHSSPKVTSDYYAGLVELPELNHMPKLPVQSA